jgi:hypothetical protein
VGPRASLNAVEKTEIFCLAGNRIPNPSPSSPYSVGIILAPINQYVFAEIYHSYVAIYELAFSWETLKRKPFPGN